MLEVKNKHSFASRKSCAKGLGLITQKDMALTQFGFMGFDVIKSKEVGLHNATNEDLRAFVHVWRVIGCIMGIENR